jgi:hypothetical protein
MMEIYGCDKMPGLGKLSCPPFFLEEKDWIRVENPRGKNGTQLQT